ncbi:hypothetical protein P9D34_06100 [Bacillus swezeyi]|uniref:DUF3993 domain-containing protein n=1 Tax=Bacillus swezeyi TaxID=1925020 RepID=A0A1R1Q9Q1_9BACI|nr:hypothetical protein [Bacillus swezeyi]MEC1260022.1 hypothetical protein [Bacillus swezeyi]MED2929746.1 hypothetical protein [Bacillus swezeyi]MED2943504.1 hypothetical protein [Bacillus swezeyi]MED2963227.1 hypothetical protein [Bacillus swezeyi]MED2979046.1 hypothetical protein [Bacillus swezeyi]
MRKLLLSLMLVVVSFAGFDMTTAHASSVNSAKELTKQFVAKPELWKEFNNEEKRKIVEFTKEPAQKIEQSIQDMLKSKKIKIESQEASNFVENYIKTLNDDDQLAYISSLIPVTFEKNESDSNFSLQKTGSNWFRYAMLGKNVYGGKLFEFWTYNQWTYNWVKILSIAPKEGHKIYSGGWSYEKKSVEQHYETNKYDYFRNIEGHFELKVIHRWQKATVHLDTKIRANGTKKHTGDIQWGWSS